MSASFGIGVKAPAQCAGTDFWICFQEITDSFGQYFVAQEAAQHAPLDQFPL
jgi:hypothetical protein